MADCECCDSVEVHEELLKIVNETMPDENELYDLAELFKVFGDSTRIRILYVLFESAGEKYLEGTDGKGQSLSPIDKLLMIPVKQIS